MSLAGKQHCFRCGSENHLRHNCPQTRTAVTCGICSKSGHDEGECTYSCPLCHRHGHHRKQCPTAKTAQATLISSHHGRQRRLQRGIAKRDLQCAVKYGRRVPSYPDPVTGALRWKFILELAEFPDCKERPTRPFPPDAT